MELIVIDLTRNGEPSTIRNDDGEWLDHLTQYPDDYIVWRRFDIKGGWK